MESNTPKYDDDDDDDEIRRQNRRVHLGYSNYTHIRRLRPTTTVSKVKLQYGRLVRLNVPLNTL